ncbi:Sapep family Mn(2+)-dependent dipeptidase [Synergistaceae bacterium OttesenSCG-928-I11]|nr:Sapep family Mn(2+)-dependent dipeptidase [Synergistaceae bacterium OttesenSCG-928-I11]
MDKKLDRILSGFSKQLIESVCESIRIPSLNAPPLGGAPYGREIARAAEHALSKAAGLGLRTVDLDGLVAWAEYGNGDETVLAMGHLDIVPPGDGWDWDPYAGRIEDGYILGRGAQDDKGPLFGTLYAMKAVAELGVPLRRKIRVVFGMDEETSKMRDVDAYLRHEGPPLMGFTPDGEFPVVNAEKGTIKFRARRVFDAFAIAGPRLLKIEGGEGLGSVPAKAAATLCCDQRGVANLRERLERFSAAHEWDVLFKADGDMLKIETTGKAAHATLPELGTNAVGRLLLLLAQACIEGEPGSYIDFLANILGIESDGNKLGIAAFDSHCGKLTLNLGKIEGDGAGVAVDVGIYIPANTMSFETVCEKVESAFGDQGATIEMLARVAPIYYSAESELVRTLQRAYRAATGEEPQLISMCGGTYSKRMPNMLPFGATFTGEDDRAHAANERVLVSNLLESTRIMAYAILEMAK